MGRQLIVANQTLGGEELLQKIDEHARAGDSFYIVVPATGASEGSGAVLAGPVGIGAAAVTPPDAADEQTRDAYAIAHDRLREAIDRVARTGAEVDGEVGPDDPLEAVNDVLERASVDGIIISTLPPGVSRWLGMDLVSRVRDMVELPVEHVYAPESPPPPE